MVLPYAVPAIFGTVRRTQEPILPLERYALYPNFEQLPYWRQQPQRQAAETSGKLTSRISDFGLPRQAQNALKTAADSSAAWLAQGSKLNAAVTDMMKRDKSVFGERAVTVTVASGTGEVTGKAAFGAPVGQYELDIAKLASAQKNASYELTKDAPSIVGAGTYSFTVGTADMESKRLKVGIRAGDTNAVLLGKLRDAINSAEAGVKASVREDASGGLVKLELLADETGARNAFEIKDDAGSVVSATGLNRRIENASDASYRIGGGTYMDSASNDISLPEGRVTLSLARLDSPGRLTVKVEQDTAAVAERLDDVLHQVNALQDIYSVASGVLQPMLKKRIDEAVHGPGAEGAGVMRSADGSWRLDREMLEAAMHSQPDAVKQAISGRGGLASRLQQTLDRFTGLSTDALISLKAGGFQSFTLYGASSKSYLQLPLGGLFVNSVM
ncbi:flagellin hook IN motif-containing protein [Paenibacillus silvisoli]|uniref:flagellin hook IN motif-containing protein n=1 Tax=Paenibacillus silvisoli TaxID=3110539 RepID=UPI002805F94D|nr:flagellin hook IN motif-containing protein [Paenibacillus silvisoli]